VTGHQDNNSPSHFAGISRSPTVKMILYCVYSILLIAFPIWLTSVGHAAFTDQQYNLDLVTTVLALAIGAMAITRYLGNHRRPYLVLSICFLGVAGLDANHAYLVAVEHFVPEQLSWYAIGASEWLSSQSYQATLMTACWLTFLRGEPVSNKPKTYARVTAAVLFSVIAAALLFTMKFPVANVQAVTDSLPSQPDMLATLLFTIALIGFLLRGRWVKNKIEHWLVLSLIASVIGQFYLAPQFGLPAEIAFLAAHIMKLVSYGMVFSGLLLSGYSIFRNLQKRGQDLWKDNTKTASALSELAALQTAIDEHCIVYVTDPDHRYTDVNDKFCKITQYGRDELIGNDYSLLKTGTRPPEFYEEIAKTLAGGEIWHGEIDNRAKDGSTIWLITTIVPIKNQDGNIVKHISIRTDITDRKRMEDKLETSKVYLASRVDELEDLRNRLEQQSAEAMSMAEDLRQTKDLHSDAISAIAEGFVLWDSDDRLIMCNEMFQTIYAGVADILEPGLEYERFIREACKRGVIVTLDEEDMEHAVRERCVRHRESVVPHDERLGDGRWIRVSEREASDGRIAGIVFDISERKQSERSIKRLAETDVLTGLPNRSLFRHRLDKALRHAERTGDEVGVMLLDLDHFKNINDTMGHPIGDALLREVAKRLLDCVRDTDTVARLGGDEFAVIATHLENRQGFEILAKRIVSAISAPFDLDGQEVHTGVSIGITVFPVDNGGADDLLRNADISLYRAKEQGRGQYKMFDTKMNTEVRANQIIENYMREAIETEQFRLHFQPQIDVTTGNVIGAEALLRWTHPERGVISPMEFIPIAEASRLIIPIGDWVIREACRFNKGLQDIGLPPLVVAVNLSPLQFKHQDMLDCLETALSSSGLDSRWLELEITETIAMEKGVIRHFHQLKKLGLHLAIDDFGKGYSSLNRLKDFPVDRLKIDKSFVRSLHSEWDRNAICRAIIQLGHSLNLKVIAEGVETFEELEQLQELGCDEAQGFLFSPPLPQREFTEFVKKHTVSETLANVTKLNPQRRSAS